MSTHALHVVPRIDDEASGPSYSVVQLCKALRADNSNIILAVLDSGAVPSDLEFIKQFPIVGFPARLGRSHAMKHWLRQAVMSSRVSVIHNHSLWMMPNVYAGWAVQGTETPLVVSPRGTLSKWALNHSKWVKRAFWCTAQRGALNQTACFHATADDEYQDIRNAGFQQPVCIIPNGIEIPETSLISNSKNSRRHLLFLSRIHPKKGVDILLHAWSAVSPSFPDWELQIVGPDNIGYLRKMRTLANKLKLKNTVFHGARFGEEKWRAYQEAELYVLPTHSENWGITVAESLASGTPAIVSRGAPWSGLTTHRAGWWIDGGVDSLVACLEEALSSSPEKLASMGESGRRWMKDEYSWKKIAEMMNQTYEWLLNGGEVPECIKY